jgi:hypothetical protein
MSAGRRGEYDDQSSRLAGWAGCDAMRLLLKHAAKNIPLAEVLVAGTRKRRMIRDGVLEAELAEPAIGEVPLESNERLQPRGARAYDAWIKKQHEPDLSRPEAVRRLVDLGLKAKSKV